jgi:hypothetical protein
VLKQELAWAREQEYIRAYPEDDIEEVIRIRAQVFMDFGIELYVHETHEMVRLHQRYRAAARVGVGCPDVPGGVPPTRSSRRLSGAASPLAGVPGGSARIRRWERSEPWPA